MIFKTKIYWKYSLFLFILFLVLSLFVSKLWFENFDFNTTAVLQNQISRRIDIPLSYFSLLGSFEITTIILGLIFIYFLVKKKKIFFGLGAFFIAIAVEVAGKIFVFHPSPPFFLLRYNLGFFFPSFFVQTGNSYPSGHMTRTAFLIVIMIFLVTKSHLSKLKKYSVLLLLLIMGLLMFISRIYLGEHWFSDVFGGALLGISFGILGLALNNIKQ